MKVRSKIAERAGAPKQRRSLTHVGGRTVRKGDEHGSEILTTALDVPSSSEAEEAARAHVHGFHSYPARMHPLTARRLIEALSSPGNAVLDPFCGSGTVLVEAWRAGRRALGVDANPLAVRLARLKTTELSDAALRARVEAAREVAGVAEVRRKAKSGPSRRYGPADVALFAPHVLLELDGLRVGLDGLADAEVRADLELCLSSILTKVSRQASDTSTHEIGRRIAAGFASRLLVRKAEELCERIRAARPERRSLPCVVLEGDARRLAGVADGSVDLVVSSPPYPGTYDYLAHHAARLRWLRLRADRFDAAEIGSRRALTPLGHGEGRKAWQADLVAFFRALRRVGKPDARTVLLIADSVLAGAPLYALDSVTEAARVAGLTIMASASQDRPHFHGPTARAFSRRPRQEHAVLLGHAPT